MSLLTKKQLWTNKRDGFLDLPIKIPGVQNSIDKLNFKIISLKPLQLSWQLDIWATPLI